MARILIVDENAPQRHMLGMILCNNGYEVFFGLRDEEDDDDFPAWDSRPVDIVITDIFTLQLEGLQLVKTIREQMPDCKMISLSGRTALEGTSSRPMGAVATLNKPLNVNEVLGAIEDVLGADQGSPDQAHVSSVSTRARGRRRRSASSRTPPGLATHGSRCGVA